MPLCGGDLVTGYSEWEAAVTSTSRKKYLTGLGDCSKPPVLVQRRRRNLKDGTP